MADDPPSDDPKPLLDYEGFLAVDDIASLEAHYREAGNEGKREELFRKIRHDWYLAALDYARRVESTPESFQPDVGSIDGIEVRIWGLFHGLWGGADKEYKEFVRAGLRDLDEVLFENAVGYYYKSKNKRATIPDYVLLFPLGSVQHGVFVGIFFPLLMKDLVWEVFSLGNSFNPAEPYVLSPKYHSLPVEARRGVEAEEPIPLPTKLEVEEQMRVWDAAGALAAFKEPYAIVPRSMFMAAFAYGYAQSRSLDAIDMVVGDLHTGEILHFLADPPREHPVWKLGERYGRLSDGSRKLKAGIQKLLHLGLSASIGAPILVGILFVVFQVGLYLWRLF